KLLVFLFVLAAAFVPAAGVMAADYDYEVDLSRIGSLRGKLVQPGDIIRVNVEEIGPEDMCIILEYYDGGDLYGSDWGNYTNPGLPTDITIYDYSGNDQGFKGWYITSVRKRYNRELEADSYFITLNTKKSSGGGGNGGDDDDDVKPAVINPDAIAAFFFVNGGADPNALFGKQKQGVLGEYQFNSSRPAGFKEAFSFSMSYKGANTFDRKQGVLQLYIPTEFLKPGRQFMIMAIDKNGNVKYFADTDAQAHTITANIDLEGYAFDLIYID
nr:hypothetical protein [Lachnospiraceae bacterium]